MNPRRLYRSSDDRILAGVAGGVAAYFDVDPVIVRIIWFLSMFFTGSLTFWAYLVMIIVVPLEPTEWAPQSPWAPGGGPGEYPASYAPPAATASSPDPSTGSMPPAGPDAAVGTAPDAGREMPPAPGAMPGQSPTGWWGYDWRTQRRQERWEQRAQRWQQRAERHESRGYSGPGLVFGLLLILVGGMLAWHQVDPSFDLNVTWPVVVVAFGAILVASSVRFRDR